MKWRARLRRWRWERKLRSVFGTKRADQVRAIVRVTYSRDFLNDTAAGGGLEAFMRDEFGRQGALLANRWPQVAADA